MGMFGYFVEFFKQYVLFDDGYCWFYSVYVSGIVWVEGVVMFFLQCWLWVIVDWCCVFVEVCVSCLNFDGFSDGLIVFSGDV